MAGFVTARDGIYNVLSPLIGTSSGDFKAGYAFDRRGQTDATGEGYPFFTVSPAGEPHTITFSGTQNSQSFLTLVVRIFHPFNLAQANDTAFLALVDRALTALLANAKITLAGSVISNKVAAVKLGYNDDTTPTARVAEVECVVQQLHDRTA